MKQVKWPSEGFLLPWQAVDAPPGSPAKETTILKSRAKRRFFLELLGLERKKLARRMGYAGLVCIGRRCRRGREKASPQISSELKLKHFLVNNDQS
jgi:hypothetical protein